MARDEIQRLRTRIQELETQLADRTRELEEARLKIEQMAVTDELTGAANRRQFLLDFDKLLQQAARTRRPLALLLVDLQHFRAINDTHGATQGDAVLKNVAYILRDNARSIDILGRTGGDEFALALPETDLQGARAVAERLRRGAEALHLRPRDAEGHALSLAVGGCVLNDEDRAPPRDPIAAEDFFAYATQALEAAQRGADDQVVCVTFGRSPLDRP